MLLAAAFAVTSVLSMTVSSAENRAVRIGIQKYGKLILLKSRGTLEKRLEGIGYKLTWAEFPAGPQLLEALNAGAVDFGNAGEAPDFRAGRQP